MIKLLPAIAFVTAMLLTSPSLAQDSEAPLHTGSDYLTGQLDLLTDEAGEDGVASINQRLFALHTESNTDVHIVVINTTEGVSIVDTAIESLRHSHADALILVAGEDQAIGVVGMNIEPEEGESVASIMVSHFDKGLIRDGFEVGIRRISAAMAE